MEGMATIYIHTLTLLLNNSKGFETFPTLIHPLKLLQSFHLHKKGKCSNSTRGKKRHETFFTDRVVKYWSRFLREVINAPGLSVLRRHLHNAFNTFELGQPQTDQAVGLDDPCRSLPAQIVCSVPVPIAVCAACPTRKANDLSLHLF